jgi:hypothetical protein
MTATNPAAGGGGVNLESGTALGSQARVAVAGSREIGCTYISIILWKPSTAGIVAAFVNGSTFSGGCRTNEALSQGYFSWQVLLNA